MATRRTTFDKLQRERAKRAKASAKREARQERKEDGEEEGEISVSNDSPEDLLARIEDLHKRFDAKQIPFEDFEAEKIELFERLAALPME
ncbi:MAG: hypothetical protein SGJ13_17045 [Actinomycetota bacterium]|nr:hypothetical protein [Actinomycetota bacterium]